MRFLRTIRFDASDERVFPLAAAPGEWAVPGGFNFADADPAALPPRQRRAFASGFLGTGSFGWSTLTVVAEIDAAAFDEVVERLARRFVDCHGAPDLASARPVARAEADFAAGLCDRPLNTLIALERSLGPSGVVERFRSVELPREASHARIWEIVAGPEGEA